MSELLPYLGSKTHYFFEKFLCFLLIIDMFSEPYLLKFPDHLSLILWEQVWIEAIYQLLLPYKFICDAIKQNESEVEKYDFYKLAFWHFLLGYCLGFNLLKTPQRLGNWFQRHKLLMDLTNN